MTRKTPTPATATAPAPCRTCRTAPARPDRTQCTACARRSADRALARYHAMVAAGRCAACGGERGAGRADRTLCRACTVKQRPKARRTAMRCYHRRKEAGLCVTCGTVAPEPGRTGCRACMNADNRRRKGIVNLRRAEGLCVRCAAPTAGTRTCETCAARDRHSAAKHGSLPVWEPRFIVVELATGARHGPWESAEEIALCLAFAKLSRHDVEIIADTAPAQAFLGRTW